MYHDKNFALLTVNTVEIAIKHYKKLVKNGGYRINIKKPGRRTLPVNVYLSKVFPNVLKYYDERGEHIGNRTKYNLAQLILSNPENYVHFGADADCDFTITPLRNDHSRFFF